MKQALEGPYTLTILSHKRYTCSIMPMRLWDPYVGFMGSGASTGLILEG